MDKRIVDLIEWIVKHGEQSGASTDQTVEVSDLLDAIGHAFDVPHFAISSTVNHITQEV